MKNELFKIIQHYGVNAQQRQLAEEVFELQEAITLIDKGGAMVDSEFEDRKAHIAEEIADVTVIITQFIHYYGLDDEEIYKIADYKIKRQLERIQNE